MYSKSLRQPNGQFLIEKTSKYNKVDEWFSKIIPLFTAVTVLCCEWNWFLFFSLAPLIKKVTNPHCVYVQTENVRQHTDLIQHGFVHVGACLREWDSTESRMNRQIIIDLCTKPRHARWFLRSEHNFNRTSKKNVA